MQSIVDMYTRYQYFRTFAIVAIVVSLVLLLLLLANGFVMYNSESKEKDEHAHRVDALLLTSLVVSVPISLAIFYSAECLYKEITTACSEHEHELCKSIPGKK